MRFCAVAPSKAVFSCTVPAVTGMSGLLSALTQSQLLHTIPGTRSPWSRHSPSSNCRTPFQAPGHRGNKLFTVASNACGSSVWNLLRVTLLAPRILRWFLDFWNICGFCLSIYVLRHWAICITRPILSLNSLFVFSI